MPLDLFGPRMRGVVRFFQALDCDMGVDLGCGKVGVSQQGLNAAQISAVVEQMRGEAVS